MKNQIKTLLVFAAVSMVLYSCTEEGSQTVNKVSARPSAPILANTVKIGTQVWMARNLNVSHYSDGTPIPQVTDITQWPYLTTGAWCYYDNDSSNGPIYGKLYNWSPVAAIYDAASAANPALRKKLAPTGWHIPSFWEWVTVTDFLGGMNVAGGPMKATTLWSAPNTAASNSSGFTGLPAGVLVGGYNMRFDYIGLYCSFWTSKEREGDPRFAWVRKLYYNQINAFSTDSPKVSGLSVRCLRD